MSPALLLAWSSPTSTDVQAEFDDWYDNIHIPQVREAIPSITRTTRYRVADPAGTERGRFLTVYELDVSDVDRANSLLLDAVQAGRLDFTTSMDMADDPPSMQWYVQHP